MHCTLIKLVPQVFITSNVLVLCKHAAHYTVLILLVEPKFATPTFNAVDMHQQKKCLLYTNKYYCYCCKKTLAAVDIISDSWSEKNS